MEKQSFWLPASAYHVTLDGTTVRDHKVAYRGYDRSQTYANEAAARSAYDRLCAKYAKLAKPAKPAKRSANKIEAPKLKPSRPLSMKEAAALAGGPARAWRASDAIAVERSLGIKLPAAFRTFVIKHGATSRLGILTAREMIRDTNRLVRVPRDTRWETEDGKEVAITTDHLTAFAVDGPEVRWCFCGNAVYRHHQDEPRALDAATRGWLSRESARPDYADFAAWLRAAASRASRR